MFAVKASTTQHFEWMRRGLVLSLAVAPLWGCSSTKAAQKTGSAAASAERLSESIVQEKAGNEKVVEYDLNHDKKPDVWAYFVTSKDETGKEVERLVRKELDINWDGK